MIGKQAATAWLILFGSYLFFAASLDTAEIVAGGAVGCVAALLFVKVRRHGPAFRPPLRWFVPFKYAPRALVSETWLLARSAVYRLAGKRRRGRFMVLPFSAPGGEGQRSAARGILTFGICLTPNSYVVCIDRPCNRVLIRQLVGRELAFSDRVFLELS